ncbi:hypothetical protein CHS0354_013817 [Potamilus streckersoni]|uniref:Costars domain-containing protein n=1 Tax=Potamilus streckersoni TaxID=2493646 RepID=A0AAE0SH72_9BIVA|nr:hypothetical protein CHS0354_013817 [Potamilus streckersoni]
MMADRPVLAGISRWQNFAKTHQEGQMINPFHDYEDARARARLINPDVEAEDYGMPVKGSLTYIRGQKAGEHITGEVIELCKNIVQVGDRYENGQYTVTFGKLFKAYEAISNKVVGMLMRARKHKLVHFEGEMLYQGRDDDVVITLFKAPEDDERINAKYWKSKE